MLHLRRQNTGGQATQQEPQFGEQYTAQKFSAYIEHFLRHFYVAIVICFVWRLTACAAHYLKAVLWIGIVDPDPNFYFDPDPDWHQNNADPHVLHMLEKLKYFSFLVSGQCV